VGVAHSPDEAHRGAAARQGSGEAQAEEAAEGGVERGHADAAADEEHMVEGGG